MIRSPGLALVGSGAAFLLAAGIVRLGGSPFQEVPAISAEGVVPAHRSTGVELTDMIRRDGTPGENRRVRDDVDIDVLRQIRAKQKKVLGGGPKRYDEPQAAMDFFLRQRLHADSEALPLEEIRKTQSEIARRLERRNAAAIRAGREIAGWTEIGPPNIGGRTRGLVINPANPNTIYAAGVAGGVWKSTDAGASWTATDDFMANLSVSTLAMDPTDPSVLYAGTGEGFFGGGFVRGLGIFKTTDGGATWNQLESTVGAGVPTGAFHYVNEIVISPANHERVYAATRYGVWKSTDGGLTWSVALRNPFYVGGAAPPALDTIAGFLDIAIRQDTAPGEDTLLASSGLFFTDGLYRSTDSGSTWATVGTPLDLVVPNQGRMEIAFAPSNNDTVYVSMADNGEFFPYGTIVNVFRSVDGGITWEPRLDFFNNPNSPFLLSNIIFGNGCFGFDFISQGWYDNVIKVDPIDADIVWVGGIDLFRSDDGGANFGIASYWYAQPSDPTYVHADHHALVFHPNYDGVTNQTLYSGSDGGLARTDNARAATAANVCPLFGYPLSEVSWVGLNNGYGVTQFYHGDSAKDGDFYAGGTQDNGTLLVDFVPPTTDWHEILGGDGGYFAFDHTDSQVLYAETQRFPTMEKSTDGGASFFSATDGIEDFDGLFITPFAMDPSNAQVLWTGGSRPWRTTNGATSWELAAEFLTGSPISAIAIAPSDSDVVYVGTVFGEVARTDNALIAGAMPSWQTFGFNNGLPPAWISSIAVHPTDPQIAYCTTSTFGWSHVLKTEDGGATWLPIDNRGAPTGIPDLPSHWIAVRPCDPQQLYVGTDLGVFESLDGGSTWEPASVGLANTVVEALDFQSDFRLVAFTHGRGAFRTFLSCPCTSDDDISDCNTNSNPDRCDVVLGTSADCNGNEIPDECELVGNDCNSNGVPDECEPDCQPNGIPDHCDLDPVDPDDDGSISTDCDDNAIPDECDPDCNGNGIPDACDLDAADPDGDGNVSVDCDANGFPDDCDALGGGLLLDVDFESGLPAGWSATGIFAVTSVCGVQPACNGSQWAYAGSGAGCFYGDAETGELVAPAIQLGPTDSVLSFCTIIDTELDFDFADVWVNDTRVFHESGLTDGWEDRTVDLTAFAGHSVTLRFRFESDAFVSGTRGWFVDQIQVTSGNPPQQACCMPDGSCQQSDPGCCLDDGGSPRGAGSVCTDRICECNVDADCDNGLFCDGKESCNLLSGCESGADVCTTAANPFCDETSDSCTSCLTDAHCDDGVDCTLDACDRVAFRCTNTTQDAACDDGDFCNGAESCDLRAGCRQGVPPICDDRIACTVDRCDSNAAACQHTADDSICDDGEFCNGAELCSRESGCGPGLPPSCADANDNNLDTCDEKNDSCRYGALVVTGDSGVTVGRRGTYRSFVVYDDGAEEEVTNRVTWRVLSDLLPNVESRACVFTDFNTMFCRSDLYGERVPADEDLIGVLVEARFVEESNEIFAMQVVSVLPPENLAAQPVTTATDTVASNACGVMGMVGIVLPFVGLGGLRYAPRVRRRSRRR